MYGDCYFYGFSNFYGGPELVGVTRAPVQYILPPFACPESGAPKIQSQILPTYTPVGQALAPNSSANELVRTSIEFPKAKIQKDFVNIHGQELDVTFCGFGIFGPPCFFGGHTYVYVNLRPFLYDSEIYDLYAYEQSIENVHVYKVFHGISVLNFTEVKTNFSAPAIETYAVLCDSFKSSVDNLIGVTEKNFVEVLLTLPQPKLDLLGGPAWRGHLFKDLPTPFHLFSPAFSDAIDIAKGLHPKYAFGSEYKIPTHILSWTQLYTESMILFSTVTGDIIQLSWDMIPRSAIYGGNVLYRNFYGTLYRGFWYDFVMYVGKGVPSTLFLTADLTCVSKPNLPDIEVLDSIKHSHTGNEVAPLILRDLYAATFPQRDFIVPHLNYKDYRGVIDFLDSLTFTDVGGIKPPLYDISLAGLPSILLTPYSPLDSGKSICYGTDLLDTFMATLTYPFLSENFNMGASASRIIYPTPEWVGFTEYSCFGLDNLDSIELSYNLNAPSLVGNDYSYLQMFDADLSCKVYADFGMDILEEYKVLNNLWSSGPINVVSDCPSFELADFCYAEFTYRIDIIDSIDSAVHLASPEHGLYIHSIPLFTTTFCNPSGYEEDAQEAMIIHTYDSDLVPVPYEAIVCPPLEETELCPDGAPIYSFDTVESFEYLYEPYGGNLYDRMAIPLKTIEVESNYCAFKGTIPTFIFYIPNTVEGRPVHAYNITSTIESFEFPTVTCFQSVCIFNNITDILDNVVFLSQPKPNYLRDFTNIVKFFITAKTDIIEYYCVNPFVDIIDSVLYTDFEPLIWWFDFALEYDYEDTGREEVLLGIPFV